MIGIIYHRIKFLRVFMLVLLLSVLGPSYAYLAESSKHLEAFGLYHQKNYEKAEEAFTKLLSENNSNREKLLYLRAICRVNLQKFIEAEVDLKKVNTEDRPGVYLYLASVYANTNRKDAAFKSLVKAYQADPFTMPEKIRKESSIVTLKDEEEWFDLMQTELPNEIEILNEIDYLRKRKEYDKATNKLIQEIQNSEHKAVLHFKLAQLYLDKSSAGIGALEIQKARELDSKNQNYKVLHAKLLYNNKEYQRAFEIYSDIIKKSPEYSEAYYLRAQTSLRLKQYRQAQTDINIYTRYFSNSKDAQYLSALINSENGETLEALKLANEILKSDQSKPEFFKLRGKIYLQSGTYKYAASDYSMALDLDPADGESYLQYGTALFKLNKTREACHAWRKAQRSGEISAVEFIEQYCKE